MPDELCKSPEAHPSTFLHREGLQPDMKFGSIAGLLENAPDFSTLIQIIGDFL